MKFCFHNWGKWSEPISTTDYVKVQLRYCLICNVMQLKKIKQPWNVWVSTEAIRAGGKA